MNVHNASLKPIKKQFIKYVVPSVIGMTVQAFYTVLDGIIVGQGIGEIGLASINIVFPYGMIVIALTMLIGIGGANIYSIYKAQGEAERANNVYCQCLTLAAVIGTTIGLAFFLFREQLVLIAGANDVLLPSATLYLKWLSLFFPLQMVAFGLSVFIRNDDAPKLVMKASIMGAVANAILDVFFILVLHYGIEVSAMTNGVGALIELAFYAGHLARKKGMLRIGKPKFYFADIKRILSNGIATFLMEFSLPAVTFSFNLAIMRTTGTLGITAYSIVGYVCSIINMVLIGVTQGAQPLMSFYHGRGDKKAFSYSYRLGIKTNLIISVVLVAVSFIFSEGIVTLFRGGNPELTALTSHMLRLYSMAHIAIGGTLINILYFQTMERNVFSAAISFLRCIGFIQVFLLISVYLLDGRGLFLAFFAGELCHLIISLFLVRRAKRLENTAVPVHQGNPALSESTGCVITISREYGSAGRMIGRKVAQALNIPFYDKEIIGMAAEQAQLSVDTVEQSDEKAENSFQFGLYAGRQYMPISDRVFLSQRKVIEEIAYKGSGVIVGRCADHILRDHSNSIRIFIHASFAHRVQRAIEEYQLEKKDAEQTVRNHDMAREGYYNHYTGEKWGDAHQYHLSINSDMGLDRCVELILHAVSLNIE